MNRQRNLRVVARFQPGVVDDLFPELVNLVGTETVFTYTRQMDEDEPFPDEWVLNTNDERFGKYWIAERDLEIIRVCAGAAARLSCSE